MVRRSPLDLALCGVPLCVRAAPSADPSAAEGLIAALRARLSDGGTADAADGGLLEEQLPEEREVRVRVRGGRAIFEHGGLAGALDLERGLLLAPPSLVLCDAMLRAAVSLGLARRGALLLHAAALVAGDRAVVATGASGAGKSTLAAAFGALSDELVAVERKGGGWVVAGTPWWRGSRGRLPLGQLVWLVRGEPPSVRPVRRGELFRALMREAGRYLPLPAMQRAQFTLCAELAARGGLRVCAREGGVVADVRSALSRSARGRAA